MVDLMVIVLGGLVEFERVDCVAHLRGRTRVNEVHFGRHSKMTRRQRQEPIARLHAGETQGDLARSMGWTTISRLIALVPPPSPG